MRSPYFCSFHIATQGEFHSLKTHQRNVRRPNGTYRTGINVACMNNSLEMHILILIKYTVAINPFTMYMDSHSNTSIEKHNTDFSVSKCCVPDDINTDCALTEIGDIVTIGVVSSSHHFIYTCTYVYFAIKWQENFYFFIWNLQILYYSNIALNNYQPVVSVAATSCPHVYL